MEDLQTVAKEEFDVDWATAKDEIVSFANKTAQAAYNGDKSYFENMIHGGEIPVYPEDDASALLLPPKVCATNMHDSVQTYWDLLYAMVGIALITLLLPYLFSCCSKKIRYRVSAWIYTVGGLLKVICGLLLATALKPTCPVECGEFFCSLRQYNPGPIWGVIVIFVGLLWLLKGCTFNCAARRATRAAVLNQKHNNAMYETAALTAEDESDEEEGGIIGGKESTYKDQPDEEPQPSSMDNKLI